MDYIRISEILFHTFNWKRRFYSARSDYRYLHFANAKSFLKVFKAIIDVIYAVPR